MTRIVSRLGLLSAVLLLGACAHHAAPPVQPVLQDSPPVYSGSRHEHRHHRDGRYGDGRYNDERPVVQGEFGVVRALENVNGGRSSTGAGAVIGGVVGGVTGRQFGDSGYGKAAGTAVGVFLGAILGNEIERQNSRGQAYTRVQVTMDRGGDRSFNLANTGELRVGDRVRIENNQVYRM